MWPAPYRLGVVEGLTISSGGFLTLSAGWVPMIVSILLPLPPNTIKNFIRNLADKVAVAGSPPNSSVEEDHELSDALAQQAERMPEAARADWLHLADLIDPLTG